MAKMLETTAAVMDALGGNAAVGKLTRRGPQAVSNWRRMSTFPSNTYLVLTAALHLRGCEAPSSLWRMLEPRGVERQSGGGEDRGAEEARQQSY